MSAMSKFKFATATAALTFLCAGYVAAQQQAVGDRTDTAIEQPAAQNPAIGNRSDSQRGAQTDQATTAGRGTANFRGNQQNSGASNQNNQDVQRYVAGCLLSKNKAEVEMAEFAQQQAQTPEVKEFAQQMVQDHGKLIQEIQKLAGNNAGERTQAAGSREGAGQNAAEQSFANRAGDSNSAVDQLLALEQQIVEKCSQAAKQELQQKQGVEFDKCYIGSQINGHMQMLAALEVIQQQGPEQVQQLAQQAHPKVKQHLDHAKQIMKQLEGDANATGSRAARQPTQPQQR